MMKTNVECQAVLFDMGHVLVRFSHDKMHRQLAAVAGVDCARVIDTIVKGQWGFMYEAGIVTTDELHLMFEKLSGRKLSRDAVVEACADIFEPLHDTWKVVDDLKAKGKRLVLVSNTCEAHSDFVWKKYPILQKFDHLVLSWRVRAMKPYHSFYHEAFLASKASSPDRCIFIDDVLENCEGASRFGFRTHQFVDATRLRGALAAENILI